MNFKPRESKLICSVVNRVSERFLMCCLRNSIVSLDFFSFLQLFKQCSRGGGDYIPYNGERGV